MNIRVTSLAAFLSAISFVCLSAPPSQAVPVSDWGWAPQSPTICGWGQCMPNHFPNKTAELQDKLRQMMVAPDDTARVREQLLKQAEMYEIAQRLQSLIDRVNYQVSRQMGGRDAAFARVDRS